MVSVSRGVQGSYITPTGSDTPRTLADIAGDAAKRLQIIDARGKGADGTTGGGASDSNFTNADSRIACRNGPVAVSNLRLVFSNYAISSGKEVDGPNAVTVRAAIEVWSGSSTTYITQGVTFNGSESVALGTRAGLVVSDPIGVVLEPGQWFAVRTNAQVTSGDLFQAPALHNGGSTLTGDPSSGNGGNMIRNTSATVVYDTGTITGTLKRGFCHMAVLGVTAAYAPAVVIFGDSIADGSGDNTATNLIQGGSVGYIPRGLVLSDNTFIPHAKVSVSGTNMSHIGTADNIGGMDNHRRWSMLEWATHAIFHYGRNDLAGGRTLAQLQADSIAAWARAKSRGVKVAACTILPYTTSTDSWATTGNQTPGSGFGVGEARDQYNDWLLTKLADGTIDYVVDANPYVESQSVPGVWVPNYTTDGVHPNPTGHQAAAAAVRAWGSVILTGA